LKISHQFINGNHEQNITILQEIISFMNVQPFQIQHWRAVCNRKWILLIVLVNKKLLFIWIHFSEQHIYIISFNACHLPIKGQQEKWQSLLLLHVEIFLFLYFKRWLFSSLQSHRSYFVDTNKSNRDPQKRSQKKGIHIWDHLLMALESSYRQVIGLTLYLGQYVVYVVSFSFDII
jgi:hypothetical protein